MFSIPSKRRLFGLRAAGHPQRARLRKVLLSPASYVVVGLYPAAHAQFGTLAGSKGVDVPPPPPLTWDEAVVLDAVLIVLEEQDVPASGTRRTEHADR